MISRKNLNFGMENFFDIEHAVKNYENRLRQNFIKRVLTEGIYVLSVRALANDEKKI